LHAAILGLLGSTPRDEEAFGYLISRGIAKASRVLEQ